MSVEHVAFNTKLRSKTTEIHTCNEFRFPFSNMKMAFYALTTQEK
jgi:hypothetical protein